MDVAHQASLSMGFSWQEYWSGLPFPSPRDLPHIEPASLELEGGFIYCWVTWEAHLNNTECSKQLVQWAGPSDMPTDCSWLTNWFHQRAAVARAGALLAGEHFGGGCSCLLHLLGVAISSHAKFRSQNWVLPIFWSELNYLPRSWQIDLGAPGAPLFYINQLGLPKHPLEGARCDFPPCARGPVSTDVCVYWRVQGEGEGSKSLFPPALHLAHQVETACSSEALLSCQPGTGSVWGHPPQRPGLLHKVLFWVKPGAVAGLSPEPVWYKESHAWRQVV